MCYTSAQVHKCQSRFEYLSCLAVCTAPTDAYHLNDDPFDAGCHVANCRRQDAIGTAVTVDGDLLLSLPSNEELAAHPMSAVSRTLHRLGDDDKKCVATCNEDKIPADTVMDDTEFFECWGDFKWVRR